MKNTPRWITAMHEASHANAYLSYGITPDSAELYNDNDGKVHHGVSDKTMALRLQDPRLREQYAVIAFAGIVMETICQGHDVSNNLIIGDNRDLERVTEYGYVSDYDRMAIQLEALSIVESSEETIRTIAGVLHHSGSISGENLKTLWDYHHRKQA